jgi:dATP pyrophosphohydrolase
MTAYKQPVSVLVVIYTCTGDVLLLERADHPGYWQSVTGSRESAELLSETAIREVREETGLEATLYGLNDWEVENVYEIYPQWRYRYAPGVTHNREHVFGLELPMTEPVHVESREHLRFQWLGWQEAANLVFSPSNRDAILRLRDVVGSKAESGR